MTLLVASLFLPYTIEFHLKQDSFTPDLISSLPIQTKQKHVTSTSPNSPITNASILTKRLTAEDFKSNNSSIEDFFYKSHSPSASSTFNNSIGDELRSHLLNLQATSNSFIPQSRVKLPMKNYKKSKLKYGDDFLDSAVLSEADDTDNEAFPSNFMNYNLNQTRKPKPPPKFGGFSGKDISMSKDPHEIYNNSTFSVIEFHKGNGALINAITTSLDHNQFKWFGTIGIPTDDLPDSTKNDISQSLSNEYNCESIFPSDFTFQSHYKHYCKQILWPTLHYQIPDDLNTKSSENKSWECYKQLNQLFADKIIEAYKPGDLIWVHDYHLFLVPEMIRSKLPHAKIGFYLHVSFPSSELFKCFAKRESMLIGILGSNYISFQTDEYVRHFSQTCNKLLLADISKGEVRYKGSTIKLSSLPVGIDSDHLLVKIQESNEVLEKRKLIRERWPSQRLIVGRDKFDKIRGVKQKLLAYELFLKQNPEHVESTVLIQICLKSKNMKDTSKLDSEIMSIVDRINTLSSKITANTQPVVFLHQDIEFTQYLALMCEADCFIVSSMREGMNLTCHEFIVATTEKKSPLILSEFTGSASVFPKGALKINPWDIKQFSLTIKEALNLNKAAKARNWDDLIYVVQNQDCHYWVKTNMDRIQSSWKVQMEKNKNQVLNVDLFKQKLNSAQNRLFIFHISTIPNKSTLKVLSELSVNNEVYIFSDYKRLELERLYHSLLPQLGLIAENGGLIKKAGDLHWTSLVNISQMKKHITILRSFLKSCEERIPNSFIEIGETFIKFHTEKNLETVERNNSLIGDLITHINSMDYMDNSEEENIVIHATVSDDVVYLQHSDITQYCIKHLVESYLKCDTDKLIDFVTIGGKSDFIFEPVFQYADDLKKEKVVPVVFTIGYTDDDKATTISKQRVEGLNDLFMVLAGI